jgi:HEAT repeat protein
VPEADRRRIAVLAGHRGDEAAARLLLGDADPAVREAALGALARMGRAGTEDIGRAMADGDARVRRRACHVIVAGVAAVVAAGAATGAAAAPESGAIDLRPLLADADPTVVEAAAWALGELAATNIATNAVPDLAAVATDHADALCREAAVAALGAIGDERGLPAILAGTRDKPAVRRRAVIALTPFDGPEVADALARARTDRDWQVRQAAEDLA